MNPIKEIVTKCDKCHTLGVYYDECRIENFNYSRQYKPSRVKVLWILESPPLSKPQRYFYRPEITRFDGLFREMMKVLRLPISNPKNESLKQFADSGNFLIDAMKCPADKENSHLKPQMIKNCTEILGQEIINIDSESIIIVKSDIYESVYNTVKSVGMSDRVLNKTRIPYPGSGNQARFRIEVEKLLKLNTGNKKTTIIKSSNSAMIKQSILVDNITKSDMDSNQLRITISNKHIFPTEKSGQPVVYNINLVFNGSTFNCTYRIGSKDGKSRSGVLKLGSGLVDRMHLNPGDNVIITSLSAGLYEISKT